MVRNPGKNGNWTNMRSATDLEKTGPDKEDFPCPGRRALLKYTGGAALILFAGRAGAMPGDNSLVALRIWPADEYSRITFESRHKLNFKQMLLKDPDRLGASRITGSLGAIDFDGDVSVGIAQVVAVGAIVVGQLQHGLLRFIAIPQISKRVLLLGTVDRA